MVVARIVGVGDDDVGTVLLEQLDEPASCFADRYVAEGVSAGAVFPIGHARVVVVEQLDPVHAEEGTGTLKLAAADARNDFGIVTLRSRLDAGRRIPIFPVRAGDDDGPHTLIGIPGQNAA